MFRSLIVHLFVVNNKEYHWLVHQPITRLPRYYTNCPTIRFDDDGRRWKLRDAAARRVILQLSQQPRTGNHNMKRRRYGVTTRVWRRISYYASNNHFELTTIRLSRNNICD